MVDNINYNYKNRFVYQPQDGGKPSFKTLAKNALEEWLSLSFLGRKVDVGANGKTTVGGEKSTRIGNRIFDAIKIFTYVASGGIAPLIGLAARQYLRGSLAGQSEKTQRVAEEEFKHLQQALPLDPKALVQTDLTEKKNVPQQTTFETSEPSKYREFEEKEKLASQPVPGRYAPASSLVDEKQASGITIEHNAVSNLDIQQLNLLVDTLINEIQENKKSNQPIDNLTDRLNQLMVLQAQKLAEQDSVQKAFQESQKIFQEIAKLLPTEVKDKIILQGPPALAFEQITKAINEIYLVYKEIPEDNALEICKQLGLLSLQVDILFPKKYNALEKQNLYLHLTIEACKKTILPYVPEKIKKSKYFHGALLSDAMRAASWYELPKKTPSQSYADVLSGVARSSYIQKTLAEAKTSGSNCWFMRPTASLQSTNEKNIFIVSTTLVNESEVPPVHYQILYFPKEDKYQFLRVLYETPNQLFAAKSNMFGVLAVEEPKADARIKVLKGNKYQQGDVLTEESIDLIFSS